MKDDLKNLQTIALNIMSLFDDALDATSALYKESEALLLGTENFENSVEDVNVKELKDLFYAVEDAMQSLTNDVPTAISRLKYSLEDVQKTRIILRDMLKDLK